MGASVAECDVPVICSELVNPPNTTFLVPLVPQEGLKLGPIMPGHSFSLQERRSGEVMNRHTPSDVLLLLVNVK